MYKPVNHTVVDNFFYFFKIKYHSFLIDVTCFTFCMSKQNQEKREGGLLQAAQRLS